MTFGSLFSGIGGIDLGLERAGWQCAWQVEIDPFCRKVLQKHWPEVKRYGDIKTVSGQDLAPVDLLAGGFPCQDLSQAGKRAGIIEGSRSSLWFEFARLIGELRPRYVLIENVPGLLVGDGMRYVLGELSQRGYDAVWRCYRASDFGASHLRKRVFIVGVLADAHRRQREQCGRSVPDTGKLFGSDGDGGFMADARHINRRSAERRRQERTWDEHASDSVANASNGFLSDPSATRLPNAKQEDLSGAQRHEQRRAVTEFCGSFAPGPSDPRWPAILAERPDLAPALGGRLNPRFVEFLMGFETGYTETKDANAKERRSDIVLRGLRKKNGEETIQRCAGEFGHISETQILRSGLYERRTEASVEPSDIVRLLSHLVTSCERRNHQESDRAAMQVLQSSDATQVCLQYMSDSDQKEWHTKSLKQRARILLDSATSARAMQDRTKRLSKLGNAVVPQIAEHIGRILMRAHLAQLLKNHAELAFDGGEDL